MCTLLTDPALGAGLGQVSRHGLTTRSAISTLLLVSLVSASAQPQLVKDILPGNSGSYPYNFTVANNTLFFIAYDSIHGYELWKSDGTQVGTRIVKDIWVSRYSYPPTSLTNVNGTLFFRGYDEEHGSELWKSDGSEAGTRMVKDISPGVGNAAPQWFVNVNGTLFFGANDGEHGDELWKSDGSEAGTVLVADIVAGDTGSEPQYLTNLNGTLFFTANDGVHGWELWKYHPEQTPTCQANGSILQEVWTGVAGSYVADIPLTTAPSSSSQLTSFEAPSNAGNYYGQRLRGYICPPLSGEYSFWIAPDNDGELWLSSDEDPSHKQLIAYVRHGWVRPHQWEKYPTQRSTPITLQAGQRYYIEALSKEAGGGDNLSVAWATSPTATPEVIPGSMLSPFVPSTATARQAVGVEGQTDTGLRLQVQPNPFSERTMVSFTSNRSERAVLDLYDLRGMRLREVFLGAVVAGQAVTVAVDGTGLAQGLYLLRLKTPSQATHQRLLLQR